MTKQFIKPADGTLTVNIGGDSGMGHFVMISVSASNYEYQQLWFVTGQISTVIARSAVLISTGRSFNSAGLGAPTLQWNGDTLQIYNANWGAASVAARATHYSQQTYFGIPSEF